MLNRIYFETRSFSSSGSRCFLTQRRSLIERGSVLIWVLSQKVSTIEEDYSPQVSVRCSNLEETIEISVIDNGFGIPKEYYQKIFEPFKSVT